MALRQLTEAEIAADNLRRMARGLILQAERLEASIDPVAVPRSRGPRKHFIDPVTGKKETIDNSKRI